MEKEPLLIKKELIAFFSFLEMETKKRNNNKNWIDLDEGGPENYLFSKIFQEVDKVIKTSSFENGPAFTILDSGIHGPNKIAKESLNRFFQNEISTIEGLKNTHENILDYRKEFLQRLKNLIESSQNVE